MSIEVLRDIVIVVSGILWIIILLGLTILLILLYTRVMRIVNAIKSVTTTIEKMVKEIQAISDPVVRIIAVAMGVREGFKKATGAFKKKKGEKANGC